MQEEIPAGARLRELGSNTPVTAVVGAGPAGLLFCLVSRLRWIVDGRDVAQWPLYLFDKRERYERSHRLRIDPAPFAEIQRGLRHPRFDELMRFLHEHGFRPEVNRLEEKLASLVRQVGIEREITAVGAGPGEADLATLRSRLEAAGRLHRNGHLSIVAADSVHSATRELARGADPAVERLHHVVARLQIAGPGLPEHLTYVERFKLAKVLGSALDYRVNSNGYAEVDLFLTPAEHVHVEELGATPRRPVHVTADSVPAAPFFSAIVRSFEAGFGAGHCEVSVHSTFRLEHRYQSRAAFDLHDLNVSVFLVGDAAISLPFFRGMAALAASVDALVDAQTQWAAATLTGERRFAGPAYQARMVEIREREIRTVEARSELLNIAREFVRLSSQVPFPIQQWFLSNDRPPVRGGRFTGGVAANLLFAIAALVVALGAPLAGGLIWPPLGWLWLLAMPLQLLGGGMYQATQSHEPSDNPLLAAVWRIQIAALLIGGVPITLLSSWVQGRPAQLFGLFGWLLLGGAFAAGMRTYERIEHRRWVSGGLDTSAPGPAPPGLRRSG